MSGTRMIWAVAVVAVAIAAPSLAQQPAAPAPGTSDTLPPAATVPPNPVVSADTATGRLRRTHDGWRSSRVVGTTVYNDENQGIGTIDDLILGQDGRISVAVISVGGFLGIGSKLVAVSFDRLRFEESRIGYSTMPMAGAFPVPPPPSDATATRIVLPGASAGSLKSAPSFDYGG
jgi:PRC-barrel domain